jgi:dihydrofolate synthase/folylpolyglutamate synthase
LVRYNERVAIDGEPVDDASLVAAFERVERARHGVPLTYFEFGTLAALCVFAARRVDARVLEVGLGGRLDAVNAVEPDAALVTSIGLDHQDWLGPDRESIGFEKAGIFRTGKPAVVGDPDPPASVCDHARAIRADLRLRGRDFDVTDEGDWTWRGRLLTLRGLPRLDGRHQQDNAAAVLALLEALALRDCLTPSVVSAALAAMRLPGRLEVRPGSPAIVLDVAHNEDSAAALGEFLRAQRVAGETWLVIGIMRDKALAPIVRALAPVTDHWVAVQSAEPRAMPSGELASGIEAITDRRCLDGGCVTDGFRHARRQARGGDRIVVAGSFAVVGPVRAAL